MDTADERERAALRLFGEALVREDMDVRSRIEWLEVAAGGDGDIVRRVLRLMEADSEVVATGAAAEPAPDLVTEAFGAYQLVSLLSLEPAGPVYRAQHRDGVFARSVVLRFVRPGPDRSGQGARIAAALPAIAQMDHPSIAAILDGGTAPGGFGYIVSDDIEGVPVQAHIKAAGLDAETVVDLFRQAAAALAHAHAHGITHGDLTPDRILVTPEGQPVLTDFAGSLLRQGASPSGSREDVRALAAVMDALLANLPPPVLNPEDLSAIRAKGASSEPASGYRSAEALAEDLARWQACGPVSAVPASPAYTMQRAFQRRPVRLGLALMGVAVALIALTILLQM
ncbi:MAG: hypothetical protein ACK46Q_13740 [Hyphomonas sp.]